MNVPSKKEIRKIAKERKSKLSAEYKSFVAEKISQAFNQIREFNEADKVLVYHALPDEVPTDKLIAEYLHKKQLFLPRVNGDVLDILPYQPDTLATGAFNIEEPTGDDIIDPSAIDIIIVPGVAFDIKGNRVGRGKGYYDRLLANTSAVTIGVGYECQLFDKVEVEPHDKTLDYIVTENSIIKSHKQ